MAIELSVIDWLKLADKLAEMLTGSPKALAKLRDSITKLTLEWGETRVLVVGNTGSGKTSLIRTLFDPAWTLDEGTTTTADQIVIWPRKTPIIIVDTPGNRQFFSVVQEQITQVGAGSYLGIINVVTYGYNDTQGQLPEQDKEPAYLDTDNNINPKYLEMERASDLQFLEEWFEQNKSIHAKIGWIITAVNKYDLWSSEKDDVLAYYSEDGSYGKKIANAIGNAKYRMPLATRSIQQYLYAAHRMTWLNSETERLMLRQCHRRMSRFKTDCLSTHLLRS